MDNKIHEAKQRLHEKELKDFHFSERQKQNVLRKIHSPEKKPLFLMKAMPVALSILFLTIFAAGVSAIIVKNYNSEQNTTTRTADPNPPNHDDKEDTLFIEELEQPPKDDLINEETKPETAVPETKPETSEPKEEQAPKQENVPDLASVLVEYNKRQSKLKEELIFKEEIDDPEIFYAFYQSVHTKEEYYNYFSDLISPEALKEYDDDFLIESEYGLAPLPTEYRFTFYESLDYEIEKISDTRYQLKQRQLEGLYGGRTFAFIFDNINGKWIVTKIKINDSTIK